MLLCRPAILRIAPVFVSFAAATFAAVAHAQDRLFDPPAGEAFAPDRSASQAARDELTQARLALLRARLAISAVVRSAETQLRTRPEYRDLQTAAIRAASEFNEARHPALASLARDSDYTRLTRERESIRTRIRELAETQRASLNRILPLANQALAKGQRITRSEVIALALDPRVEDARQTMTEAFAQLRSAGLTYRDRIAQQPEVIMAREDVEQAKARVIEANERLALTLRMEADAERYRDRRDPRMGG